MEIYEVKDTTKINNFKEVDKLELSAITKNEGDKEILSGLILFGYEMKFGKKNENGEMFDPHCLDDYMENYFVKNKLNVPVTLLHEGNFDHLVGRVLVVETSGSGFYFVVYIPKTEFLYQRILDKIKEGILQGFSKEGWADDYEVFYEKDGAFSHILIKKLIFASLSIVSTPANRLRFDKIKETVDIQNSTQFVKKEIEPEPETISGNELEEFLFNVKK